MIITQEMLQIFAVFEKITKARAKDCFVDDFGLLTFVIEPQYIKKVIGPDGQMIEKIKKMFNRNINIIKYDGDVIAFIKNVVRPVKIDDVFEQEKVYTILSPDIKSRGMLIGRSAQILRNNEKIIKRYFDIVELKVQ